MADKKGALVGAWLAKARTDFATARRVIVSDDPILDTGVYHCQQAAEKALKAWLTHRDEPFPKTHDLEKLQSDCARLDTAFSRIGPSVEFLTPFATEFRYPGDVFAPPLEEAMLALKYAEEVRRSGCTPHPVRLGYPARQAHPHFGEPQHAKYRGHEIAIASD